MCGGWRGGGGGGWVCWMYACMSAGRRGVSLGEEVARGKWVKGVVRHDCGQGGGGGGRQWSMTGGGVACAVNM